MTNLQKICCSALFSSRIVALTIILPILFVLTALSTVVSGIWLAILGEWYLIGIGLCLSLGAPITWPIIAAPGFFLTISIFKASEQRKSRAGMSLALLIFTLCGYALLVGWVVLVFMLFTQFTDEELSVPIALYGYATVNMPLCYMSTKEPFAGSIIGWLFGGISFIVLAILHLFSVASSSAIFVISVMALFFCFATIAMGISSIPSKQTNACECKPHDPDWW